MDYPVHQPSAVLHRPTPFLI